MASTRGMTNQSPPLDGFDPPACDPALADAIVRRSAPLAALTELTELTELAGEAGSGTAREHGRPADRHHPVLHTHDRYGHRIDEVEFHPSWHWLMRRAVPTIIEVVTDDPAGLRAELCLHRAAALSETAHHVAHRWAFGARSADAPLMAIVVADSALESEAATAPAMQLATAVDADERDLLRLALAASEYYACKRTPTVVARGAGVSGWQRLCRGSGLPRLYREAPLNSIREGAGNVTALDVLRALSRGAFRSGPHAVPAGGAVATALTGFGDRRVSRFAVR